MTMIRSALSLAAQGVAVFPCCCRGKTPAVAGGLKAATTDRDQITTWWTENPAYNIGLATGEISNLFVVDVDGPDAEHELQRLELPATVQTITARGKHYFFKYPSVSVRNSASKVARGVDIRGTGGFFLVYYLK
jgi:Bifunctional DNA primase/polymerase, N-terminal